MQCPMIYYLCNKLGAYDLCASREVLNVLNNILYIGLGPSLCDDLYDNMYICSLAALKKSLRLSDGCMISCIMFLSCAKKGNEIISHGCVPFLSTIISCIIFFILKPFMLVHSFFAFLFFVFLKLIFIDTSSV